MSEFDYDFTQYDDDFINHEVPDDNFGDLPDGKYQCRIEKCVVKKVKDKDEPRLEWELVILGPKFKNRKVWKNNLFRTSQNVEWLKKDLKRIGVKVDNLKLSEFMKNGVEKMVDLYIEVQIKNDGKFINVYFNKRLSDEEGEKLENELDDYDDSESGPIDDDYPF